MNKIYYTNIKDIELLELDKFPTILQEYLNNKNEISKRAWSFFIKILLNKFNLNDLEFTFNSNGKPLCNRFFFNISHSKDVVAIAISNENIGIDVEYLDEKKDISLLSSKLLNTEKSISNEEFYTIFTKKEAKVKYLGIKLGYPKKSLDYDINDVKTMKIYDNENSYILSYKSDNTKIKVEKIDWQ